MEVASIHEPPAISPHLSAAELLVPQAAGVEGAEANVWLDRTYGLFRGNLTSEELISAATTDDARKALLDGQAVEAKDAFARCVALDRRDLLETDFTRALLRQLDATAPTTPWNRRQLDGFSQDLQPPALMSNRACLLTSWHPQSGSV